MTPIAPPCSTVARQIEQIVPTTVLGHGGLQEKRFGTAHADGAPILIRLSDGRQWKGIRIGLKILSLVRPYRFSRLPAVAAGLLRARKVRRAQRTGVSRRTLIGALVAGGTVTPVGLGRNLAQARTRSRSGDAHARALLGPAGQRWGEGQVQEQVLDGTNVVVMHHSATTATYAVADSVAPELVITVQLTSSRLKYLDGRDGQLLAEIDENGTVVETDNQPQGVIDFGVCFRNCIGVNMVIDPVCLNACFVGAAVPCLACAGPKGIKCGVECYAEWFK